MAVRMRQVREVWHSGLFWQAALALYVLFVYGHSLVPAELSSRESGAVLQMIAKIWDGLRLPGQMPTEHMVRKTAHFFNIWEWVFCCAGMSRLWRGSGGFCCGR